MKNAFSLLELIFAIVVIGIISSFAIPKYLDTKNSAVVSTIKRDISGSFIFNGLKCFHEMDTLYYSDEIFEFLYNISVGLERLFKITINDITYK